MKTEAARLQRGESQEDHSGNDYIQCEKGADSVGEELLHEQASIWTMFCEPRKERGVRRGKANNAQKQIDRFGFHLEFPPFADS